MAEVVGLVASITAIVGIAGAATKLSKTLYGVARDAGSAREDIETWAFAFASFSSVIQTAHMSLNDHFKNRTQSSVIRYIKEQHVLEVLMKHSERIKVQINKVRPYARAISSSTTLFTKFKWILRKSEVESLGPKMESVKTSLMTLLEVISLEILKEAVPTNETKKLMYKLCINMAIPADNRYSAQLKKQIKVQVKTIAFLEKRQHHSHSQFLWDSTESLTSIDEVAYDAFISLAKSMSRHGKVPKPRYNRNPPLEVRSTASQDPIYSISVRQQGEKRERSESAHVSSSRQLHDDLKKSKIAKTDRGSPLDHPITIMSSNTVLPSRTQQPSELTDENQVGRSTQVSYTGGGEPGAANQVPVEVSRPGISIESEYQNVRPSHCLRGLNPSNTQSSTSGYIAIGGVLTRVTANVDESLPENRISQNLARRLDLDIRLIDPTSDEGDLNWILLEDGQRIRKIGETDFEWSGGDSTHRRPFTVSCWVYEYDQRPLIFGRPFLETRKRRWSYTSDNIIISKIARDSDTSIQMQEDDAHSTKSSSRPEGSAHRLRRSRKR